MLLSTLFSPNTSIFLSSENKILIYQGLDTFTNDSLMFVFENEIGYDFYDIELLEDNLFYIGELL